MSRRVPVLASLLALVPLGAAAEPPLGATVSVPYFVVSVTPISPQRIGTMSDTEITLSNASANGVLVKAEVFTRRGKPLLGFNIPLAGHETATFTMSHVLTGHFNVSPTQLAGVEVCAGWAKFPNPDSIDLAAAKSIYPYDSFTTTQQKNVLDSLDTTTDTPECNTTPDGIYGGPIAGAITFDVVNYCTTFDPSACYYFRNDAIATKGWNPNVLHATARLTRGTTHTLPTPLPISIIPFDASLYWIQQTTFWSPFRTGCTDSQFSTTPDEYRFEGDGRIPVVPMKNRLYLSTPTPWVAAGGAIHFDAVVFGDTAALGACPTWNCSIRLLHRLVGASSWPDDGVQSADVFNGVATFDRTAPSTPGVYEYQLNTAGCPSCAVATCDPSNTVQVVVGAPSGDANGDGLVNVSDVLYLINFLFAGGPAPK